MLRHNTRFSWKKHYEQKVDSSVQFIWRVFEHHCFEVFKLHLIGKTKCTFQLQRWLSVSVCNMKINILNSVYLSLVHAPEILVLLVSLSDFTWAAADGHSSNVQPVPRTGHKDSIQVTVLQTNKQTNIFHLVYLHTTSTNPHGPCGIQEFCTTAPTGEEVKHWAAQMSQPGEAPKAQTARSALPLCFPTVVSFSLLPFWHLLVFSPLRLLFLQTNKLLSYGISISNGY